MRLSSRQAYTNHDSHTCIAYTVDNNRGGFCTHVYPAGKHIHKHARTMLHTICVALMCVILRVQAEEGAKQLRSELDVAFNSASKSTSDVNRLASELEKANEKYAQALEELEDARKQTSALQEAKNDDMANADAASEKAKESLQEVRGCMMFFMLACVQSGLCKR
jgi:hypothetical protein